MTQDPMEHAAEVARVLSDTPNILSPLLSAQEDAEFVQQYRDDPQAFMEPFLRIRTESAQILPWSFWPEQQMIYDTVQEIRRQGKPVRIIALKARRRGVSTLGAGFAFTRARLWPNSTCMLLADDRTRAEKIFQMIKYFHQYMPPEFRAMTSRNAKDILRFENPRTERRERDPGLGSEIIVGTAGKATIGRGLALQALLATEVAHWPADVLPAVLNALADEADTFGFLESTANGAGNLFHELWEDALRPESEWVPVFIPFWMSRDNEDELTEDESLLGLDPALTEYEHSLIQRFRDITPLEWLRKIKWRRRVCVEKCRGSELITRQEHPSTSAEAFVVQGQSVFDVESIQFYMVKQMCKPQRVGRLMKVGTGPRAMVQFVDDPKGDVQIWKMPEPRKEQYSVGADAALGQDNSVQRAEYLRRDGNVDYCAAVVTSWNREVVATCRTRDMNPHEFGEYVALLGTFYNYAMVYPEAGNDGGGQRMLWALKQVYHRIGRWQKFDHQSPVKYTKHIGFDTNAQSKSMIVGELMLEIKRGAGRVTKEQAGSRVSWPPLRIYSKDLIREMTSYVMGPRGSVGASRNRHDDLVIALGLSLLGLLQMPPPPPKGPPAHLLAQQRNLVYPEGILTPAAPGWNPGWLGT